MAGAPGKQLLTRPLGPGHPCPLLASGGALSCRHTWGPGPPPRASNSTCLTLGHAPPQRPGPTCPSGSEPSTAAQQGGKQGPLKPRCGSSQDRASLCARAPSPTSSRTACSANTDVHASTRLTVGAAFPEPGTWHRPRGPSVQAGGHNNGPAVLRDAAQPRKGAPWTQATAGWGPGASATRESTVHDTLLGARDGGRCGEKGNRRVPALGGCKHRDKWGNRSPSPEGPVGLQVPAVRSPPAAARRSRTRPRPPPNQETAFPA